MRNLLSLVFDTSKYTSLAEKNRARMVYGMGAILVVLSTLFVVFWRNPVNGETVWEQARYQPEYLFYAVFFYIMIMASIFLTRYQHPGFGGGVLVVMWVVSAALPVTRTGLYGLGSGIILVIIIWLSALISGVRGLAVGFTISVVMLVAGINQRIYLPEPVHIDDALQLLEALMLLCIIGGTGHLYLRYIQVAQVEGAQEIIRDRLKMADIATYLSQLVAERVSLTELLDDVVLRICDEFPDVYHAQVFLLDKSEQSARLVASTGPVGQQLIAQQHNLAVGSLSVIGQVTFKGTPIVTHVGSTGGIHYRNELLPDTNIEVALPLKIGERLIGALDLQSRDENAFPQEVVDAFMSLATRVALAIDNVRQFERAEARIQENQQLVEQTRIALREVERLNERLTGRAWSEYLRGQPQELGLSVDFTDTSLQKNSTWTKTMLEAAKSKHLVQNQQDNAQVVSIPLTIRGLVIGAMEFEMPPGHDISPDDLSLVQEVSERFGLAAENIRLIGESQRIAQREALVNEISSRLQTSNNVEATLTEAARSLRDTLKAHKVAIRLGTPAENGKQREDGA